MNDILEELKAALLAAIGNSLTTYYTGEVVLVPKTYLPALMIFGNSTNLIAKSTAKDQTVHDITIRVVMDVADKFDETGTGLIVKAHQDLIDIMEEREAGGQPKAATVLGVLRANIKGTDYLFNNDITINYQTLERDEFFYVQAECNFTATTDLVTRP